MQLMRNKEQSLIKDLTKNKQKEKGSLWAKPEEEQTMLQRYHQLLITPVTN